MAEIKYIPILGENSIIASIPPNNFPLFTSSKFETV